MVKGDAICGLRRQISPLGPPPHPFADGYARIAIELEVQFRTYTGRENKSFELADAFQASPMPLPLPRSKQSPSSQDSVLRTRRSISGQHTTISPPEARPVEVDCDPCLIREWLDLCLHKHSDTCSSPLGGLIPKIRLVDIQKEAIIEFPRTEGGEIPPYIALSWVWGSTKAKSGLTSDSAVRAAEPGFLNSFCLPPAVEDSRKLLEGLGERFLWVDLLCIAQDDEADKQFYLPRMGAVYSRSLFTIVANGMNGLQDGLPGVKPDTRLRSQITFEIDGITIISCLEPRLRLRSDEYSIAIFKQNEVVPPWQTRAWTLQEKLLSPRCLLMGSRQMYWECLQASYCEETWFEHLPNGIEKTMVATYEPMESIFSWDLVRQPREQQTNYYQNFHRCFADLLERYNDRKLTFESDVLNAFQGMLSILTGITEVEFLWGLPCSLFEQNLLWGTFGKSKRSLQDVPSWSWLNYRDSKAADYSEILFSPVAIRCSYRVKPTPNEDKRGFHLRQISNVRQYPSDIEQLDLNSSGARLVEVDDIVPSMQSRINPLFHILFWADTIDVQWQRRDTSYGKNIVGDLLLYPSADVTMKTTEGEGSDLQTKIATFLADHGLNSIQPKNSDCCELVGHAIIDTQRVNDREKVDCIVVKVLAGIGNTHSSAKYDRALLIVEKDGIAQVVGQPIILKGMKDIKWREKLVILG
ncbi:MAG: hypothetical protein Q9164_003095 [Protoblastenia rupestris]